MPNNLCDAVAQNVTTIKTQLISCCLAASLPCWLRKTFAGQNSSQSFDAGYSEHYTYIYYTVVNTNMSVFQP